MEMKKSVIVYRQGKFWYIEGIGERPEWNVTYPEYPAFEEDLNEWQEKFDSQEGWLDISINRSVFEAFADYNFEYGTSVYIRVDCQTQEMSTNIEEGMFIYIEPSEVEIRNGKAYLK